MSRYPSPCHTVFYETILVFYFLRIQSYAVWTEACFTPLKRTSATFDVASHIYVVWGKVPRLFLAHIVLFLLLVSICSTDQYDKVAIFQWPHPEVTSKCTQSYVTIPQHSADQVNNTQLVTPLAFTYCRIRRGNLFQCRNFYLSGKIQLIKITEFSY